jgi:hypothetical protein
MTDLFVIEAVDTWTITPAPHITRRGKEIQARWSSPVLSRRHFLGSLSSRGGAALAGNDKLCVTQRDRNSR